MSIPENANISEIPREVYTTYSNLKAAHNLDLSDIAKELLPDEVKALKEFKKERDDRSERDAKDVLIDLKLEDTNSLFSPEEF